MFPAYSTQDQQTSHLFFMTNQRHDHAAITLLSSVMSDEHLPLSASSASPATPSTTTTEESGGAATSAPVAARPRTAPAPPKVDRLPPWRVILHNDDVNDIGFVVESIIELVRVNPRQALLCTLTAHRKGLCHLVSTHREKAELLRDQFRSRSLTVTIEPEA